MRTPLYYVIQSILLNNFKYWTFPFHTQKHELILNEEDFYEMVLLYNENFNKTFIKNNLKEIKKDLIDVSIYNKKYTFNFYKTEIIKDLHENPFLDIKTILIYQNNIIVDLVNEVNSLKNEIHDLRHPYD